MMKVITSRNAFLSNRKWEANTRRPRSELNTFRDHESQALNGFQKGAAILPRYPPLADFILLNQPDQRGRETNLILSQLQKPEERWRHREANSKWKRQNRGDAAATKRPPLQTNGCFLLHRTNQAERSRFGSRPESVWTHSVVETRLQGWGGENEPHPSLLGGHNDTGTVWEVEPKTCEGQMWTH